MIESDTQYNDKIIVADNLSVSSNMIVDGSVVKILSGNTVINPNGILDCRNSTLISNNIELLGDFYITTSLINITGNITIDDNAEMNVDNTTILMNNLWTGQYNITLNQTASLFINNTSILSGIKDTYFDIILNGMAVINNTTMMNINHGLIINTNLIDINNVGIFYCNEYALEINSTNITIHNTSIGDNKYCDINIVNSSVNLNDCNVNYSKIQIDNGSYTGKNTMVIHVINETNCNISEAQVLIKNCYVA